MGGLAGARRRLSRSVSPRAELPAPRALPRLLACSLAGLLACSSTAPATGPQPPAAAKPAESELAQRLAALARADEEASSQSTTARAAALRAHYGRTFSAAAGLPPLRAQTTADVEVRFRAAQRAAWITLDEVYLRDMVVALDELERRGQATAEQYRSVHASLIAARLLPEARTLAQRHPELALEAIPEIREAGDVVAGQPSVWTLDETQSALVHRGFDLRQPAQIVVVSSAWCHFCEAAAEALQADPELLEIFAARSHWIAPPEAFGLEDLQKWNRAHPRMQISLAIRRADWPAIDGWNTPTFYFFQNGALITQVSGWPRAGRRAEIAAALRTIGLM